MYKLMLILIITMLISTIYTFKQLDNSVTKARDSHTTSLAQLDSIYNIK